MLCVAVEADLGSVLLVPHVESRDVHHLRFVHRHDYIQPEGNNEAVQQVISCEYHQNFSKGIFNHLSYNKTTDKSCLINQWNHFVYHELENTFGINAGFQNRPFNEQIVL